MKEKVEPCKDEILNFFKGTKGGLTLKKHPKEASEMEEGGEDPEDAGDVDENIR